MPCEHRTDYARSSSPELIYRRAPVFGKLANGGIVSARSMPTRDHASSESVEQRQADCRTPELAQIRKTDGLTTNAASVFGNG